MGGGFSSHLISSSVLFTDLEVIALIGGESVVFCLMEEGMHSGSIVGVHQRFGSVNHCAIYCPWFVVRCSVI